jgi:hypothetical protein
MFSLFLLLFLFVYSLRPSFADKIVYIDRPAHDLVAPNGVNMKEPVFDPWNISAAIGENIIFTARFGDQSIYGV